MFLPDYYNYYYGGYCQNNEVADTPESSNPVQAEAASAVAAVEAADYSEAAQVPALNAPAAEVSGQPDSSAAVTAEVCFFLRLMAIAH